jgi:predicted methyltransferase
MFLKPFFTLLISSLFITPVFANHHEKGENAEASLEMALANDSRSESDRGRDEGRKPAEVIEYLGISPGMTVVDVLAAGGYYSEVLSLAVGGEGKVYAQNSEGMLRFRDGANEKAISARLEGNRLPNVERLNKALEDTGLADNSIDAAMTALNFHDIYNGRGAEAALGASKVVFAMLKPNGVFGVIDHNGNSGTDNSALHRIEVALVIETLEKAGFTIETSNLLANPDDAHDKMVFDPSVRGKTDRFLILARKPG